MRSAVGSLERGGGGVVKQPEARRVFQKATRQIRDESWLARFALRFVVTNWRAARRVRILGPVESAGETIEWALQMPTATEREINRPITGSRGLKWTSSAVIPEFLWPEPTLEMDQAKGEKAENSPIRQGQKFLTELDKAGAKDAQNEEKEVTKVSK